MEADAILSYETQENKRYASALLARMGVAEVRGIPGNPDYQEWEVSRIVNMGRSAFYDMPNARAIHLYNTSPNILEVIAEQIRNVNSSLETIMLLEENHGVNKKYDTKPKVKENPDKKR